MFSWRKCLSKIYPTGKPGKSSRIWFPWMLSCVPVTKLITSNNRKTDENVVALANRFWTSSVKCWTTNIHASKGPVIIMNQLIFFYNSPFKDSHSHPIHPGFPIIASNKDIFKNTNDKNPYLDHGYSLVSWW